MHGFSLKQHEVGSLLEIYSAIEKDLDAVDEEYRRIITEGSESDMLKFLALYGGKKIRAALHIFLLKGAGIQPTEDAIRSAVVIELIHTATLLHDDVLDDTVIRRQSSSFKAIYDNEKSIITGDYLLSRALSVACGLENRNRISDVIESCQLVCLGEMKQLENRNNFNLSQDDYLDIIGKKTATLFELAARWACKDSGQLMTYTRFGSAVGTLFQVVDDWLDIVGEESVTGKSIYQDIKKGKVTFPLIHLREKIGAQRIEELSKRSLDGHAFQGQIRGIIGEYKIDIEMESFLKKLNEKAVVCLENMDLAERYKLSLIKLIGFLSSRKI
jgi:octaprenyl-diphosphate synthase